CTSVANSPSIQLLNQVPKCRSPGGHSFLLRYSPGNPRYTLHFIITLTVCACSGCCRGGRRRHLRHMSNHYTCCAADNCSNDSPHAAIQGGLCPVDVAVVTRIKYVLDVVNSALPLLDEHVP